MFLERGRTPSFGQKRWNLIKWPINPLARAFLRYRRVLNEIAACNNVSAKYDKPLMAGALDPEEALPKFLAELEAAGVTTVIGEKQRQFDAWLAGNAG